MDGGRVIVGRWWKVIDGMVAETLEMYEEVEPASYGGVKMMM